MPSPLPAAAPCILGFDEDENTCGTRWVLRIYSEAFRRLAIPLKPGCYQLARRAAMLDEGAIDGDSERVHGYGAAHPSLVRVEGRIVFNFLSKDRLSLRYRYA